MNGIQLGKDEIVYILLGLNELKKTTANNIVLTELDQLSRKIREYKDSLK